MDLEKLTQCASSFGQAAARSLFAIENEEKLAKGKLQQTLSDLKKNHEKNCAIAKSRSANNLSAQGIQLKDNLCLLNQTDDSILTVCEYLQFGNISIPEMSTLESSLKDVPFIIPMIGHGNLALLHKSDDTRSIVTDVVWKIISETAPGQLRVITYNPHLRNQLSFLSNVEQFSTLIAPDQLYDLLEDVSKEILHVDSLLKSAYPSLIDLRRVSKQPVGTLQLVVLQDTDFLADEKICSKFGQVIKNCARAGVCFIISDVMNAQKRKLLGDNSAICQLDVIDRSRIYSSSFNCTISIDLESCCDYEAEVASYIKKASATSVVSIPFAEIEDTEQNWNDSTKDGITFSMGRSGLDVITLRLGDEKTQLHNALITGAAGKGKSNLLEVIIHSICNRYSPKEVELYLLDFKDGLTFKPYSDTNDGSYLPHAKVLGLESERDIGLATLRHLEQIREERAKVFKDAGNCKDIAQYRTNNPDVQMPRIIIMIDEYQKLFEIADDIGLAAASVLENLVRQGRACGIHVILASQTISGAAALLGHTDAIYGQFPIRIGLQNSLNESYATFGQGNDGAAKLRVRGEAILNCNYGEINSNQRFTVAYAEPEAMKALRKKWYLQIKDEYLPPIVFRKNEEFRLPSLFKTLKGWRQSILQNHLAPMIPCGVSISVNREHVGIRMSHDSGRNVAIIGSGDDAQSTANLSNDAIGLIQIIGISLALQHVDGNARFTLINGLDKTMFDKNGMQDWLSLMEQIGFFVDVIEKDNVSSFFQSVAKEVTDSACTSEPEAHYILCLALDRCSNLSLVLPTANNQDNTGMFFTPVAEKGVESFQKVLQFGSSRGTHIISWWNNATIYKDHIGFQGDGFVNTKILLRVDNNTAQSILGMFTTWSVQINRALVHDNTDLESNCVVAPYKPVSKRDCGLVLSEDWNV